MGILHKVTAYHAAGILVHPPEPVNQGCTCTARPCFVSRSEAQHPAVRGEGHGDAHGEAHQGGPDQGVATGEALY